MQQQTLIVNFEIELALSTTVRCQLGTDLEREIVGPAGEVYPAKTF